MQRKSSTRILWLGRTLPFPVSSGDRAYVAGYLQALAERAEITYMAIGNEAARALAHAAIPHVTWKPVDCALQPRAAALLSRKPYVSALHSPPEMVSAVRTELARSQYDWIVLDQYGLGWVLADLARDLRNAGCRLIYFSHNHEAALAADTVRDFNGSPLKRLLLARNARLIAAMERELVRRCDVVTAISDDDAEALSRIGARRRPIVLPPGIDAPDTPRTSLSGSTPRRMVVVGSFHWVPKQINLDRFLMQADVVARKRGAQLDVIGEAPDGLRKRLSAQYPWVRFVGFVDDLEQALAQYRIGINFEQTGGGLKLKNLTYIAAGLPIAAIEASLTGIPQVLAETMIVRRDAATLMEAAMTAMDDLNDLSARSQCALRLVRQIYSWERGADALVETLTSVSDLRMTA